MESRPENGSLSLDPQLELQAEPLARGGELGDRARRGRRIAATAVGLLVLGAIGVGTVSMIDLRTGPNVTEVKSEVGGSGLVTRVPSGDVERALAMLAMTDSDRGRVRNAVDAGKVRLAWITVSDFDEEDGDWVTISAGGFRQDVRLFKKPLTVAFPYIPGLPATVTGHIDGGGGGITVAVHVGANLVSLRPLKPGESIEVPTP